MENHKNNINPLNNYLFHQHVFVSRSLQDRTEKIATFAIPHDLQIVIILINFSNNIKI